MQSGVVEHHPVRFAFVRVRSCLCEMRNRREGGKEPSWAGLGSSLPASSAVVVSVVASHSHSLVYMHEAGRARDAGRRGGRLGGDLAMNYATQKRERGRRRERGRERERENGEKFAWAGQDRAGCPVRVRVRLALDQWDSIDQIGRHFTILLNYRNGTVGASEGGDGI